MDAQAEYDNRARVRNSAAIIEGWARDAATFRASWPHADLGLRYGTGERERLDLFRPGAAEEWPLALFLHGGYWQALDRSSFSHVARGPLAEGVAVASYDLCPSVPLARIVEQARAAAAFLHRRSGRRLLAFGHSAGGHLAATLMATHWRTLDAALPADLVPAALPVSGVFELEPLLPTTIASALRLTSEEARVLSPRWFPPPLGALHVAVGAEESAEFIRQSKEFAAAWGGGFEALAGCDHFTVLAPLAQPRSAFAAKVATLAPR